MPPVSALCGLLSSFLRCDHPLMAPVLGRCASPGASPDATGNHRGLQACHCLLAESVKCLPASRRAEDSILPTSHSSYHPSLPFVLFCCGSIEDRAQVALPLSYAACSINCFETGSC